MIELGSLAGTYVQIPILLENVIVSCKKQVKETGMFSNCPHVFPIKSNHIKSNHESYIFLSTNLLPSTQTKNGCGLCCFFSSTDIFGRALQIKIGPFYFFYYWRSENRICTNNIKIKKRGRERDTNKSFAIGFIFYIVIGRGEVCTY